MTIKILGFQLFVSQSNNETLTNKISTNNDEIKRGFITIHHKY